jgi:kynurenine formamidase
MKKKVCLSHIIGQDTPAYGNRDRIFIRDNSSIQKGESANTSCWIFSNNHIGTHIDTPYHFLEKGKKTYEYAVEYFFFSKICLVDIPCNEAKLIDTDDFKALGDSMEADIELLLIRTGYEQYRQDDKYWNDNPGLAPELADYLRAHYPGLRCVGFDFISLTSWKFRQKGRESHRAFLDSDDNSKEILIIEDMSLINITQKLKQVIVAPLFVEDGNGGAVTVFATID